MTFFRKSYKWIERNRYFAYHLRWQLSALIMMPIMYSLNAMKLPLWVAFMTSQFFGALIFWYIDLFIFSDSNPTQKSKVSKRSGRRQRRPV